MARRLEGNKQKEILQTNESVRKPTQLQTNLVLFYLLTDWSYIRTRDGFSLTSATFHFMTLNALEVSWLSTPTKSCPLYCWGSFVDIKTPLPFVPSNPTPVPDLTVALSFILMSNVRDLTGESLSNGSILTSLICARRWWVPTWFFGAFYMWKNISPQKKFYDIVLHLYYFSLAFATKQQFLNSSGTVSSSVPDRNLRCIEDQTL